MDLGQTLVRMQVISETFLLLGLNNFADFTNASPQLTAGIQGYIIPQIETHYQRQIQLHVDADGVLEALVAELEDDKTKQAAEIEKLKKQLNALSIIDPPKKYDHGTDQDPPLLLLLSVYSVAGHTWTESSIHSFAFTFD
jgi:hypothetical protein